MNILNNIGLKGKIIELWNNNIFIKKNEKNDFFVCFAWNWFNSTYFQTFKLMFM